MEAIRDPSRDETVFILRLTFLHGDRLDQSMPRFIARRPIHIPRFPVALPIFTSQRRNGRLIAKSHSRRTGITRLGFQQFRVSNGDV